MATSYNELNKSSVIENLELGNKVIMCEFSTRKMVDCDDMSVKTVQFYKSKTDTKFFREIVTADE